MAQCYMDFGYCIIQDAFQNINEIFEMLLWFEQSL